MKVLMINGSRNAAGCTFTALSEIAKELNAEGIYTEILHVGKGAVAAVHNLWSCDTYLH